MSVLHTTVEIVSCLAEYDLPVDVEYTYHPGRSQTSVDPAEPASCEITGVAVVDAAGTRHPAPWLCDLLSDDEEMLSLCELDADERAMNAADDRADAAREDRALRDAGL